MLDRKPLPVQVLQWQSQPEQKALANDRRSTFTTKHTFDEASKMIWTSEDVVMEETNMGMQYMHTSWCYAAVSLQDADAQMEGDDSCSAPTSAGYCV